MNEPKIVTIGDLEFGIALEVMTHYVATISPSLARHWMHLTKNEEALLELEGALNHFHKDRPIQLNWVPGSTQKRATDLTYINVTRPGKPFAIISWVFSCAGMTRKDVDEKSTAFEIAIDALFGSGEDALKFHDYFLGSGHCISVSVPLRAQAAQTPRPLSRVAIASGLTLTSPEDNHK